MKLHRFIGDFDFSKNEIEITNLEQIKQIKGVLRLEVGDSLILFDGFGASAEVAISNIEKGKITCMVSSIEKSKEGSREVSLYLAILKKENFELAVQKAVEVGVTRIVPVITERTVKTGLNIERLNKIILEACEQAGRSLVPTLSPIMEFSGALEDGKNNQERIIFHFVEGKYRPDKNATTVGIFVGPEGGFSEQEILEATESGYNPASLGDFTLRGETASIIATYRAVNSI